MVLLQDEVEEFEEKLKKIHEREVEDDEAEERAREVRVIFVKRIRIV